MNRTPLRDMACLGIGQLMLACKSATDELLAPKNDL